MKKLLLFSVLVLALAFPMLAQTQVEFEVDIPEPDSIKSVFESLSGDQETVVDFLYLTQAETYCTENLSISDDVNAHVCVFDDPTDAEAQHLYVVIDGSVWSSYFVVHHEGQIVAVLSNGGGIKNLPVGEYRIVVIHKHYRLPYELIASLSFSILDKTQV